MRSAPIAKIKSVPHHHQSTPSPLPLSQETSSHEGKRRGIVWTVSRPSWGGGKKEKEKKVGGRKKKYHTIVVVVTHHHLLRLAVLAHLAPEVLVEGVEVVLQLARVHLVLGVVGRVLVQVREEDGLRVRGFHVLARAAVAVAAGADLVVEGAVDLVLLRAEDGGEVAVGKRGRGELVWDVDFSGGDRGGGRKGEGGGGRKLTWPCFVSGRVEGVVVIKTSGGQCVR